jgi:hypothetical protein
VARRRQEHDEQRAIAQRIQRSRPQWLVVWGCYSHRFWGYPLFEMRPRMLVHAGYPDALLARLDDAEHRFRVRPGKEQKEGGE